MIKILGEVGKSRATCHTPTQVAITMPHTFKSRSINAILQQCCTPSQVVSTMPCTFTSLRHHATHLHKSRAPCRAPSKAASKFSRMKLPKSRHQCNIAAMPRTYKNREPQAAHLHKSRAPCYASTKVASIQAAHPHTSKGVLTILEVSSNLGYLR